MAIRKRVKRAIVSFFKDELLEWIRHDEREIKITNISGDLKLYQLERDIDLIKVNSYGNEYYVQILADIQNEFTKQIIKFTNTEMIDQSGFGLHGITKVRFSLHIASPKDK